MPTLTITSILLAGAVGSARVNDDVSVRQVSCALDDLEKDVSEGNLEGLATRAWSIITRLVDNKGEPDFTSDARFGMLVARWKTLGPKIAVAAGGHSKSDLPRRKDAADEDEDRE